MKKRLQQQLQSQVADVLPGYVVRCEFSADHFIDVELRKPATHEVVRITGVKLNSLLGQGSLEKVVDQLMFEILAIAVPTPRGAPSRKVR
ncbi:hypothetical protein FQZ97_816870 [compost metagenome]